MNRKGFLGTAGALMAGLSLPARLRAGTGAEGPACKKPPDLRPGDTIGITAPAGYILPEEVTAATTLMQDWGYRIRIGDTVGKKDFTYGGTDAERLADLQQMLDDPTIQAIMCARGGYGAVRIVDQIDWTHFRVHPKWLIGFSDITVLHSHIHTHCRIASLHSKMTNSFPDDLSKAEPAQAASILSIRDALIGKPTDYTAAIHPMNRTGSGEGMLVGGNLKTLETLAGSASDIDTDGKILFVEDTGEYLYSIDRMFWNLKRTGKLSKLKGLIVGGFNVKEDDPGDEFGKTVPEIVLEKLSAWNYPVCFDFPVGHQKANFPLKCGVKHRLDVTLQDVKLMESF